MTRAGDLDILGTPGGVDGFEELASNAIEFEIEGSTVLVASIEDLIRMKRSAGRAKDLIEVEVLGALRDEIENEGRDSETGQSAVRSVSARKSAATSGRRRRLPSDR